MQGMGHGAAKDGAKKEKKMKRTEEEKGQQVMCLRDDFYLETLQSTSCT